MLSQTSSQSSAQPGRRSSTTFAGVSGDAAGARLDRVAGLDFATRVVLGGGFAWLAGRYLGSAGTLVRSIEPTQLDAGRLVEALSIGVIGCFTTLIAWLFVVRLRPIRKTAGLAPRIAALIGGFLHFALLLLPRHPELSLLGKLVSSGLVLLGNGLAVAILWQLGRSFSIMPEARRLVTTGAYGVVRHPLYLAEAIATFGILIQFMSAAALLICLTQLGFQLVRMHYEEGVLRTVFPEYETYSQRTARLLPGIY